jgi:hypothetical protein
LNDRFKLENTDDNTWHEWMRTFLEWKVRMNDKNKKRRMRVPNDKENNTQWRTNIRKLRLANLVWHIDNNSYFLLVLLFCELACDV